MAFNREEAKSAASDAEDADPEFTAAMSSANLFQIQLLKENNRHKEAIARGKVGVFGRFLGDSDNGPLNIAFITVLLGFVFSGVSLALAYKQPDARAFWMEWSKGTLALSRLIHRSRTVAVACA